MGVRRGGSRMMSGERRSSFVGTQNAAHARRRMLLLLSWMMNDARLRRMLLLSVLMTETRLGTSRATTAAAMTMMEDGST